jgi:hypothetical protein
MDIAAMLIIVGLIAYTSIYRRRGRMSDKLFFVVSLLTLIMAAADGVTYVLDGSSVAGAALISLIFNNIFFCLFEAFCGLTALYLYHRLREDEGVSKVMSGIILAPAAVMILMEIVNNFLPFLFYVDTVTNEYIEYPMYYAIFIGPAIYAVFAVWVIAQIDKSVIWLFLLLLASRLFLGSLFRGVSSTALVFAIGLVFVHIHVMGSPFYEEEV